MENVLVIAVGIGFLITVIGLMLMMFALFFFARDMGDNKRISEQTFVQTQLNNARLLGVERQVAYMHDVIRLEEQAGAMMNMIASNFGAPSAGAPGTFPPGTRFQTEDGSIVAMSFEELLDKMTKDPRYGNIQRKDMDYLDGLFNTDEEEDGS